MLHSGAQSRGLAQGRHHTSTNSLSPWIRGAKTVAAVRDSHASETIRQPGHSGAEQGTQQAQNSHTRDELESSETVRGSEVDAMAYMSEESFMPNIPKRVNSASNPGMLGSSEAEDSAQGVVYLKLVGCSLRLVSIKLDCIMSLPSAVQFARLQYTNTLKKNAHSMYPELVY